jgi:hypothetical protein
MPPVEFEKKEKQVLITVREDLVHGFAYENPVTHAVDDYFPGDTLFVTPGWASMFIQQGWAVAAAQGAKPGRAQKKEAPKAPAK